MRNAVREPASTSTSSAGNPPSARSKSGPAAAAVFGMARAVAAMVSAAVIELGWCCCGSSLITTTSSSSTRAYSVGVAAADAVLGAGDAAADGLGLSVSLPESDARSIQLGERWSVAFVFWMVLVHRVRNRAMSLILLVCSCVFCSSTCPSFLMILRYFVAA